MTQYFYSLILNPCKQRMLHASTMTKYLLSHDDIKLVANSFISSRKAVLQMAESEVVMATGSRDDDAIR